MLELSPAYFEYMQSTFNKATSLIKIVGFYSGTPFFISTLYSLTCSDDP